MTAKNIPREPARLIHQTKDICERLCAATANVIHLELIPLGRVANSSVRHWEEPLMLGEIDHTAPSVSALQDRDVAKHCYRIATRTLL